MGRQFDPDRRRTTPKMKARHSTVAFAHPTKRVTLGRIRSAYPFAPPTRPPGARKMARIKKGMKRMLGIMRKLSRGIK